MGTWQVDGAVAAARRRPPWPGGTSGDGSHQPQELHDV